MEDIERKKKKQKAHRGVVTRIGNKTDEIRKEDRDEIDHGTVEQ